MTTLPQPYTASQNPQRNSLWFIEHHMQNLMLSDINPESILQVATALLKNPAFGKSVKIEAAESVYDICVNMQHHDTVLFVKQVWALIKNSHDQDVKQRFNKLINRLN